MKKLFLLLILSLFSAQSYAASCADGSEPVKSISADGTYFVYSCGGQASSSTANSNIKAVAGIDIENDPNVDFFKPQIAPYPTKQLYWFGRMWKMADFNNDGITDVLYIGTMNPNNSVSGGEDTGDICGTKACAGDKPLPSLYIGGKDGALTYSPHLLIDDRKESGMSLGRQLLVADFNSDNTLDFYVADHGIGTHNGIRDSYFLSQTDGTWVESSNTHLSHSNFQVFDHGGATGDIDNDGDMDVVITEINWKTGTFLWCLINDGTGFLNKRKCGGIFSFALELADMDGDGYLDVLLGAHEFEKSIDFTGIVWNDGRGNFPKHNNTTLPQHKKKWGTVPEVSAADLDNDGDLDIVYSRAGELYVGTAIQIIENLGNKKFKDHGIFPLVEAPSDFTTASEGNEWNDFIEAILFRDLDNDGDTDIYLASGSSKTNGIVLLNNGNFNFDLIRPDEELALYTDGSNKKIIIGHKKHIPTDEEQATLDELAAFEAELEEELAAEAADAIAKRKAKVAAAKAKRIAEEELIEKELAELEAELLEENKSSPLFDGRYSFDLFRYHDDDDWQKLGNGFVEIKNGEVMIDKDNSDLKTGSKDLYDTFSGQIDERGNVSGSVELAYLFGKDRSVVFTLNGQIDKKIWGDSPEEDFFRVYMLLVKK